MFGLSAIGYNVVFKNDIAILASTKSLKEINDWIWVEEQKNPGEYTIQKEKGWLEK